MACLCDVSSWTCLDLRWLLGHSYFNLPTTNRQAVRIDSLQSTSFRLSDRRNGRKFDFWVDGIRDREKKNIFGKYLDIQITLGLYFFGVLFSGI